MMSRGFLLLLCCFLVFPRWGVAEDRPATLGDAVRAIDGGRLDEGYALLLEVVGREPNNRVAALRLQQVENQLRAAEARRRQLSGILLPRIAFSEVSLDDALGELTRLVREATDGQTNLNLVRLYPREIGETRRITLELTNIPAWNALEMTAQQAGAFVVPETHAIKVILPTE
jgi:hypothetical protein